jgi:hypothetical protein
MAGSDKKIVEATERLLCRLTESEKAERAERMAKLAADRTQIEEAKKQSATDFKERLESVDLEVNTVAREVREGEWREIPVNQIWDYRSGNVSIMRPDTGEVLSERAMTMQERQLHFGDIAPSGSTVQ